MKRLRRETRTLNGWQTVRQSALVHPDWTDKDHRNYLMCDVLFDPEEVDSWPLTKWLTDPSHPGYVRHVASCFEIGCRCERTLNEQSRVAGEERS